LHLSACRYANQSGRTFQEVLIEALTQLVRLDSDRSGWQASFGAFTAEQLQDVDQVIATEFSRIDLEGWK